MTPYVYFLITILHGEILYRYALQVNRNDLPGDCEEYPMEPENKQALAELLAQGTPIPDGPIVQVESIEGVRVRS